MGATATRVNIGPCTIAINGTDVGGTIGDVTLHIEEFFTDRKVAQHGDSVIGRYAKGMDVNVKAVVEYSLTNLTACSCATTSGSTTTLSPALGAARTTKSVVITPVDTDDNLGALTIPNAVISVNGDIGYGPDTQRGIPIEIVGILDTATNQIAYFAASDTTAPSMTLSVPSNGATAIVVTGTCSLTFNEAIGTGYLADDYLYYGRVDTNTWVTCTVAVGATNTIVVATPAANLTAAKEYQVIFRVGDRSGNMMAMPASVKFTTAA